MPRLLPWLPKVGVPLCGNCGGILKPDIVFYGEQLDNTLLDRAYRDMAAADVVMVLEAALPYNRQLPFHGHLLPWWETGDREFTTDSIGQVCQSEIV